MWTLLELFSGAIVSVVVALLITTVVVVAGLWFMAVNSRDGLSWGYYVGALLLWLFVSAQAVLIALAAEVNSGIDRAEEMAIGVIQVSGLSSLEYKEKIVQTFSSIPYADRLMNAQTLRDVQVEMLPALIADVLHRSVRWYIFRRWMWIAGGVGVAVVLCLFLPQCNSPARTSVRHRDHRARGGYAERHRHRR